MGIFFGRALRAGSQSGVIIILAVLGGLLVNQFRADRLPLIADWSPEIRLTADTGNSLVISLEEAGALYSDMKALFLDARSPNDYRRGHILGAQNIPWQSFAEHIDHVWENIPEDALIVTYCDGETCSLSEDLARELISMGYDNVKVLLNGWTRWLEAGLPVHKEP